MVPFSFFFPPPYLHYGIPSFMSYNIFPSKVRDNGSVILPVLSRLLSLIFPIYSSFPAIHKYAISRREMNLSLFSVPHPFFYFSPLLHRCRPLISGSHSPRLINLFHLLFFTRSPSFPPRAASFFRTRIVTNGGWTPLLQRAALPSSPSPSLHLFFTSTFPSRFTMHKGFRKNGIVSSSPFSSPPEASLLHGSSTAGSSLL